MDINSRSAESKKKRWLTSPYSFKDNLTLVLNYIKGPSRKYNGSADWIPKNDTLNTVTPTCSILFLGDFLPVGGYQLEFDPRLKKLAAESDYLVVNLEGIMTKRPHTALFCLTHSMKNFLYLTELKPAENIIVSVANNHSADHGKVELFRCIEALKHLGFKVMGTLDSPSQVIADNISISAATNWSNQSCDYIAKLPEVTPIDSAFNILYPHWGHEFELYPREQQVEYAKSLLADWDMVVGHHSHVPQPISAYSINTGKRNVKQIVAYSLGDFATNLSQSFFKHGVVFRSEIGLATTSELAAGNAQWYFSYCNRLDRKTIRVELNTTCRYF